MSNLHKVKPTNSVFQYLFSINFMIIYIKLYKYITCKTATDTLLKRSHTPRFENVSLSVTTGDTLIELRLLVQYIQNLN